ncbi:MAG: glycine cleavage system aminomethyltransferase GcvT [Trichodesmium sp. St11_bin5]|nr:glycine cleavage system aminomethyltransferase GcvT [Trichodesmium sp. St11_bin5]
MAKSTESNTQPLSRTPLYDLSTELKARMVEFSGWEMPVQYTSISNEHEAVRTKAGMFDISHMGKFIAQGHDLIEKIQYLVPSDLSGLEPGKAQYTVLLNSQAGIIDDFIFYRQSDDPLTNEARGFMIVNAATKANDKGWILSHLENSGVKFQDISEEKVLLAVQGPDAESYIQQFVKENLASIGFFGHADITVLDKPGFIARTGYTGEDGFEIMVDPPVGVELWRSLLNAGVTPCGLGARDTLRLEAAMALYGQDIDIKTTPLEAGLSWLVHLDKKGEFIAREVLETQKREGVSKRLVGLEMLDRGIARHGYPVLSDGKVVGEVTSGTKSPTLGKAIALAYVPKKLAKVGQKLEVEIRGKNYAAIVVKRPFYRSQKSKVKG